MGLLVLVRHLQLQMLHQKHVQHVQMHTLYDIGRSYSDLRKIED